MKKKRSSEKEQTDFGLQETSSEKLGIPEYQIINKKTGKVVKTLHKIEDQVYIDLLQKIQSTEEKKLEEVINPIQNFTNQQLSNLQNVISDLTPSAERTAISEAIQKLLDKSSNRETFAMPSHAVMFTLLAMFAGKPDRIPRKLLAKSQAEWSEEEKKEAEEFLNSILKKETKVSYRGGTEEVEEKYIAIVSDNPKIEAEADITMTFFKEDLRFREESLALYIKRTFGPEGLRHLLGLLIGLEENFRKGHFEWSVNEHLERLGYKRKTRGSFDPELKKTSSEIIKVFTSLFITARKKEGQKEIIQGERLFSIDGFRKETFDKVIIDEKIKLRATDFWFKNAFEPKDGQSGKYTKLLKKLAQENHREHSLTIYLTTLLAVFWRMNSEQKISVNGLMEWCDLDKGKYRFRDLKTLESELNYMKEQGYLGHWKSDGDNAILSNCTDPFSLSLTLTPPRWLDETFKLIQERKELPQVENKTFSIISLEELRKLLKDSKLSIRQFSNKLGLTHVMLSYLLNGKRPITKEISEKIYKMKNNILDSTLPQDKIKSLV